MFAFFTCTHSHKDLCTAVCNLDVLVVQEAAHDGDVGLALCSADPWSLRHLSPDTARPMFTPPGVMGRDVEGQKVTVLKGTIGQRLKDCFCFADFEPGDK